MVASWCSVRHQSTEWWTMGTSTNGEQPGDGGPLAPARAASAGDAGAAAR